MKNIVAVEMGEPAEMQVVVSNECVDEFASCLQRYLGMLLNEEEV